MRIFRTILGTRSTLERKAPFLKLAAGFLCVFGLAFSQSIAVTSPAASQAISGASFGLTCSLTSAPNTLSVEYVVDGDSQGIVWSPPWSLSWNTNLRANGPAHTIYAIARDAIGNAIATSPTITFSIANTWLEPPSYINLASVTPGIPANSNWFGVVSISAVIGGTNSTNTKTMAALVDDNYSTYTSLSPSTATTMLANVDTRKYVDGPHQVCVELRDTGGTAGTLGGFPFGEQCWTVTFANKSTALLVNVASAFDSTAAGYTSFATPATPLTAGNFALACVKVTGTGITLAMSDTAANPWTALAKSDDGAQTLQCFWSNNVTGNTANVFTLSSGSNFSRPSIIVRQYSNVSSGNPINTQVLTTGTSGNCPCTLTSNTVTTTQANEILAVFEATEMSGTSYSAGAGFASDALANSIAASQILLGTATGTTPTIYTTNGSSTKWQMAVVPIKAAGTVSTPAWLTLSPKEWVISPTATQQLTPVIANTDGTTSTPAGPLTYSSANTAVCTVSASGMVTGIAFGHCPITVVSGNGLSETIHGYVSSTNVIPHFGTDGQIHASPAPGTDIWAASIFQITGYTSFADPAKSQAQYGIPYSQAGFKLYEGPLTDGNTWNTSQSSFTSALNAYIANAIVPLNTYNLYYYGIITPLVGGDALYNGTHGIGSTYSPGAWTLLANTWGATGRLMAMAGPDESDNGRPLPIPNSTMGASLSSITCPGGGSTTWTINLSNAKGPAYNGPQNFIITGATTNAVLNTTLGGSFYSINSGYTANAYSFTGPACASAVTANSSSDPGLIVEPFANKWYAGNDYTRYTAYQSIVSALAAASPAPSLAGEPRAISISDPISGPVWSSWGTFEDIYEASAAIASEGNPQYSSIYDLIDPANSTSDAANFRQAAWYSVLGSPRAWIGLTSGTPLNYGFGGPTFNVSISGNTVTFPSPHGISTIYTNISKAIITGSSNSYFNANWYIDSCPTATTCTISRAAPSATPANTPNYGTITFSPNNATWNNVKMCATAGACSAGQFTYSGYPTNCYSGTEPFLSNYRNLTFTYSGSGADPYWTTNTFIFEGYPIVNVPGQQYAIAGQPKVFNCELIWHEVPPASQTTASATLQIINQTYSKGNGQTNPYETLMGPRKPFAGILFAAALGAAGHRMYNAGADYIMNAQSGGQNNFGGTSGMGCNASQSFANCLQPGISPLYANGDTGAVTDFWATANANLILQRLANSGYLYASRAGAPDIGFNIESSLRSGAKGNLLLTLNVQDGPQTHTVDISGCAVSGQKTIRYALDWTGLSVASINAGVTTDSATWLPGGAVIYLCSNNSSAEYSPPLISARLQDVPNAVKIAVQYAYTPYHLNQRTANMIDCGTGTCTLPVDQRIGTIYYRLEYLDANGVLLATSDVQTL